MQRFAFKLMVVQSAYLIWKLYCHQVQVQIVCILLMPPPKQTSEAQNPNFQLPMYRNRQLYPTFLGNGRYIIPQKSYLMLLFQYFRWVILFICDINTLQTMDVSRQGRFVNMRFARFDDFYQSIMDEYVLFFSLYQMGPLSTNMFEVAEDVDVSTRFDFP